MNGNVIRTITIRGQAEGLDKLTADVNKLAAAQQNVAVVSEQSAKGMLSLEQQWKRQTLRLDEAARAQNNIARETKIANRALEEGLATQAQHAQRLEQINQRYAKTADATKVVTQQTGLARHELVNLGRQAQDVGVSLMSGQSPLTVLVQQGTQIADVFASSTSSLRGFFTQAIGWAKGFFSSTLGIVTAVAAVGAAAVYAASQFMTASKTIEEALEEQNRLLKESKTLLDAKTSAEQKAFAQSKALTQFQLERSERDLMGKLGAAQMAAADAARRRSTRPTQVAGEMGEAPTGVQSLGKGYEQIADAAQKLSNAMQAGLPGLAAFQEELAKVGRAHPELAQTVEEMIKLAQTGIPIEQASLKVRAISDALKGVATDAQLAAVGLGSIAQFNLANLGAEQALAATERMAQHTLAIAAAYPGMSVEVAKQLDALQGQLTIAQARTGAEQIIAQQYVTQVQLLAQGKTAEEAMAIAAGQRAIAEANVSKAIADQIHSLEDQVKRNNARVQGTEKVIEAEIAYANAIRDGASELDAQALKKATQAAADSRNQKTHMDMLNEAGRGLENVGDEIQRNTAYTNQWTAAVRSLAERWAELTIAEGVESRLDMLPTQFSGTHTSSWGTDYQDRYDRMVEMYGSGNVEWRTQGVGLGEFRYPALTQKYLDELPNRVAEGNLQAQTGGVDVNQFVGSLDVSSASAVQSSFSRVLGLGFSQGLAPINRLLEVVSDPTQQTALIQQAVDYIQRTQTPSLARQEMVDTLNDRLEQLTMSTDSLNSTMQNALSPFYSQDPRTTRLGFREGVTGNPDWMTGATNANPLVAVLGQGATAPGMANGGSFTVGGGYSANDNRMAVFPVASGEEIIVNRNKGGRGDQVINIDNRIMIAGSVDTETLNKLKISKFQQAQRMRGQLAG